MKEEKEVANYNLESQELAYKRSQKGITLVALVVTIIVLLILAGVTIMTLFGENGLISMAQKAKQETENAQANTAQGIDSLIDQMGEALGDIIKTKGELVPSNKKYALYEGVPIPGGYCVVNDVTKSDGTKDENKVSTGLVISDVEGDDLNNSKGGNQFVWVPVPDITKMYDATYEAGQLYNFTATGMNKKDYPTTKNSGNREPDVVTDALSGNDSTSGSSYDAKNDYLKIVGLEEKTANDFKTQLQNEFNSMIASVDKYDGFYIGRYETGNLEANTTSTPVVQKGNDKIHSVNWYYMYANSKKIAKNSNVTSSMIWGCQFDRTLEWIAQMNPKANGDPDYSLLTNSTSWGNYKDVGFEYTDSTGVHTKGKDAGQRIPTGSSEHNKKNHIYDLAGNVWDWTIEATYADTRVSRRRL